MNGKDVFDVIQNFKRPLKLVIRQNLGGGKYKDTAFSTDKVQHIEMPTITPKKDEKEKVGKYPLAESIAEQAVDAWASIKGVGNDFAK